ncbi:MAG: hypothetical protein H0T80_19290, partial [Betaproteobacteria bacterium]|nr:hypothetical protein [Betaproteobacteria bacterium]
MPDGGDTAFIIEELKSVRVAAPGPSYWRGFAGSGEDASNRFAFTPPWRTVYARAVESALVRLKLRDGSVGWGEATCPIAPEVVCTLQNGFIAEVVRGRSFSSIAALVDFLYDAQRCRGYLAGHYQDAVAALDIALHDALAKRARCAVGALLGGERRNFIPAYLSGARAPTREQRVELLQRWSASARAAKLFLRGSLEDDLEELAALQAAVPAIEWWSVD